MSNKVFICGVNTSDLPKLTEKETLELLKKAKAGNERAREEFIVANMRLVLSVIKRFWTKNKSSDTNMAKPIDLHYQMQTTEYLN